MAVIIQAAKLEHMAQARMHTQYKIIVYHGGANSFTFYYQTDDKALQV